MHPRIAERIVLEAGVAEDSVVLEVGPGTGILTRELLKRAKQVIAIEADRDLVEKLKGDFAQEISAGRLELVHGDIRDYPLNTAIAGNRGYEVVANIPYYLTGEIFRLFLTAAHQPRSMTLLVQKEVAERIARSPKESILSLSVKAYGTPRYAFTVKRGAFVPAPQVDSAVLAVRDISRRNFPTQAAEARFFTLIHSGFAHKRKFVRSNLAGLVSEKGLIEAGIHEKARAEDLPLSTWVFLSG